MNYSQEAEQSVLGSLLMDNRIYDDIGYLKADDFYSESHRLIFVQITKYLNEGKAVDPILLAEHWKEIEYVGGLGYLGSLVKNTHTTANAKAYANVIKSKSKLRELARIGSQIIELSENEDISEAVDQAQGLVMKLSETHTKRKTMNDVLTNCINNLDRRYQNKGELMGLSTGFMDLDKRLNGLNKANLIILAARPSMGKTTLMMNIVEHVGAVRKLPVAVFSMEMSSEELIDKSICSLSGADYGNYRTGMVEDDEWPRITDATSKLLTSNIIIDDDSALTVNQIRSRCRKIKRTHGLSLICIDYLQLMSGKGENRVQIISEISRGLKGLAKELDVPVIALSQLNRSVTQRPNKRPMMSDLRDSGAIEQDADVILFLYRDVVYDEDTEWKGITEIETSKQRSGTIGRNYLSDQLHYCRFKNFDGNLPIEKKVSSINNFYKVK